MNKKLSKSIKKYIRQEKARIRRETFDIEERKKLIDNLYNRILSPPKQEKKKIPKKTDKKKEKEPKVKKEQKSDKNPAKESKKDSKKSTNKNDKK